jgi:hypothetical protein
MTTDSNGRLKLPWPVFVWGIAMLIGMLVSWADVRVKLEQHTQQLDAIKNEIDIRVKASDIEHANTNRRIDRLEGRGSR